MGRVHDAVGGKKEKLLKTIIGPQSSEKTSLILSVHSRC